MVHFYSFLAEDSPSLPSFDKISLENNGTFFLDYEGLLDGRFAYFKLHGFNGHVSLQIVSEQIEAIIFEEMSKKTTRLTGHYSLAGPIVPIYFVNEQGITCQDCSFDPGMEVIFTTQKPSFDATGHVAIDNIHDKKQGVLEIYSPLGFAQSKLSLFAPFIFYSNLLNLTHLQVLANHFHPDGDDHSVTGKITVSGSCVFNTNQIDTRGLEVGADLTVQAELFDNRDGDFKVTGTSDFTVTEHLSLLNNSYFVGNLRINAGKASITNGIVGKSFAINANEFAFGTIEVGGNYSAIVKGRYHDGTMFVHGDHHLVAKYDFMNNSELSVRGNSLIEGHSKATQHKISKQHHFYGNAEFRNIDLSIFEKLTIDGWLIINAQEEFDCEQLKQAPLHKIHQGIHIKASFIRCIEKNLSLPSLRLEGQNIQLHSLNINGTLSVSFADYSDGYPQVILFAVNVQGDLAIATNKFTTIQKTTVNGSSSIAADLLRFGHRNDFHGPLKVEAKQIENNGLLTISKDGAQLNFISYKGQYESKIENNGLLVMQGPDNTKAELIDITAASIIGTGPMVFRAKDFRVERTSYFSSNLPFRVEKVDKEIYRSFNEYEGKEAFLSYTQEHGVLLSDFKHKNRWGDTKTMPYTDESNFPAHNIYKVIEQFTFNYYGNKVGAESPISRVHSEGEIYVECDHLNVHYSEFSSATLIQNIGSNPIKLELLSFSNKVQIRFYFSWQRTGHMGPFLMDGVLKGILPLPEVETVFNNFALPPGLQYNCGLDYGHTCLTQEFYLPAVPGTFYAPQIIGKFANSILNLAEGKGSSAIASLPQLTIGSSLQALPGPQSVNAVAIRENMELAYQDATAKLQNLHLVSPNPNNKLASKLHLREIGQSVRHNPHATCTHNQQDASGHSAFCIDNLRYTNECGPAISNFLKQLNINGKQTPIMLLDSCLLKEAVEQELFKQLGTSNLDLVLRLQAKVPFYTNGQAGELITYDAIALATKSPLEYILQNTLRLMQANKLPFFGQLGTLPHDEIYLWAENRMIDGQLVSVPMLNIPNAVREVAPMRYGASMLANRFVIDLDNSIINGALLAIGPDASMQLSAKNLVQIGGVFGSEYAIDAHIDSYLAMMLVGVARYVGHNWELLQSSPHAAPELIAGDYAENQLHVEKGCSFVAIKMQPGQDKDPGQGFIRIQCEGYVYLLAQPIFDSLHAHYSNGYSFSRSLQQLVTESNLKVELRSAGELVMEAGLFNGQTKLDCNKIYVFTPNSYIESGYGYSWEESGMFKTEHNTVSYYKKIERGVTPTFTASLVFNSVNGAEIYALQLSGQELHGITHEGIIKLGASYERIIEHYSHSKKIQGLFVASGLWGSKISQDHNASFKDTPILTSLTVEKDIHLVSENGKVTLSANIHAGGNVKIAGQQGVTLETAIATRFLANRHEERTISFNGLNIDLRDSIAGVKSELSLNIARDNTLLAQPIGNCWNIRGNLTLSAPQGDIIDQGASQVKANNIDIGALNLYSYEASSNMVKFTSLEKIKGAIVVGLINPFAALINSAESAVANTNNALDSLDNWDTDSEEGMALSAIGSGLALYSAYQSILAFASLLNTETLKAMVGAPIQYAGEFRGAYSKNTQKISTQSAVPSYYEAENEVHINLTEMLYLGGTKIVAKDGHIKAKNAILKAVIDSFAVSDKLLSLAGHIGTQGAGINLGGSKMEHKAATYKLPKIIMTNELIVEIEDKLEGSAQIEAKRIKMDLGELLLQSLQDVSSSQAWQMGIGLGAAKEGEAFLNSLSLSNHNGKGQWVGELAAIIGQEAVEIVVARSINLIGATIASISTDLADNQIDNAALKLTAAQLFFKDIAGYDESLTLGGAFSRAAPTLADGSPNPRSDQYNIRFGAQDIEQMVKSVIGRGKIIIAGKEYGDTEPIPAADGKLISRDIRDRETTETITNISDRWYGFSWVKDETAQLAMEEKAQRNLETIAKDPIGFAQTIGNLVRDYSTNTAGICVEASEILDIIDRMIALATNEAAITLVDTESDRPDNGKSDESEARDAKQPATTDTNPVQMKDPVPSHNNLQENKLGAKPAKKSKEEIFEDDRLKFMAELKAYEIEQDIINFFHDLATKPLLFSNPKNTKIEKLNKDLRVFGTNLDCDLLFDYLDKKGAKSLAKNLKIVKFGFDLYSDYSAKDLRFHGTVDKGIELGKSGVKVSAGLLIGGGVAICLTGVGAPAVVAFTGSGLAGMAVDKYGPGLIQEIHQQNEKIVAAEIGDSSLRSHYPYFY